MSGFDLSGCGAPGRLWEPAEDSPGPAAPRRLVLADDVYESLKAYIMDLQVPPGIRINMDALARQLGVSITPIREALSRLESDGLVVKLPMRGYAATPLLTAEEFEDLYLIRIELEPWAAGRAAETAGLAQIDQLRDILESGPSAPGTNNYDSYRAFVAHDARFHEAIQEIAGSDTIRSALQRLHAHLHLFRISYERGSGVESIIEHRAVFETIALGDSTAARKAMTEHLTRARERLRPAVPPGD